MFHFTLKSENAKTGPIPVTTTSADSCPDICPLKSGGCYAKSGPLALHWARNMKLTLAELLARVEALPQGQLWRHNQAGDLPQDGRGNIDGGALRQIVDANQGKRGFTYTHHLTAFKGNREAIRDANRDGFTINLSANTLQHADKLADLAIAPVVVVLPSTQSTNTTTPNGRKVVICPATQRKDVTCATCKLCSHAKRSVIVGFPAHGTGARKATAIAQA